MWAPEKEDGRMAEAAVGFAALNRFQARSRDETRNDSWFLPIRCRVKVGFRWLLLASVLNLFMAGPLPKAQAQTDCLACHGDQAMTDASGHKIGVDGDKFGKSIHGGLKCNDCTRLPRTARAAQRR